MAIAGGPFRVTSQSSHELLHGIVTRSRPVASKFGKSGEIWIIREFDRAAVSSRRPLWGQSGSDRELSHHHDDGFEFGFDFFDFGFDFFYDD